MLVIVAAPQWGKTELMKALAAPLKGNIVVVDTAQRGEWVDFGLPVTEDWRDIGRLPGLIWRPNIDHVLEPDLKHRTDDWSQGLELILAVRAPKPADGHPKGGTTVLLDEMLDSAPARPHPLLRIGITQGEGRGLGLWGASQSPYGVSQRLLGAAKHRFLGRIGTAQERGIIEASWGTAPAGTPPDHGFYYIGPRGETYGPVVLEGGNMRQVSANKSNSQGPLTETETPEIEPKTELQEAAPA